MSYDLFRRATLIWLGFFALAFVNGAIREVGIKRAIAEPATHHLSALTAVLLTGYAPRGDLLPLVVFRLRGPAQQL